MKLSRRIRKYTSRKYTRKVSWKCSHGPFHNMTIKLSTPTTVEFTCQGQTGRYVRHKNATGWLMWSGTDGV